MLDFAKEKMSESSRFALVLGATGGIGGETALALSRRGWKIRAFSRAAKPADSSGWEWVKGDALDRASVEAAARGVSGIVHAVNPPGWRNWATLVLPMIENTLAAAQASGARVLLPGTIYNYGPDAFPVLRRGLTAKCDYAQGDHTHRAGAEAGRGGPPWSALADRPLRRFLWPQTRR
jgi:nucleoside-diphosphate-sugar epimerase